MRRSGSDFYDSAAATVRRRLSLLHVQRCGPDGMPHCIAAAADDSGMLRRPTPLVKIVFFNYWIHLFQLTTIVFYSFAITWRVSATPKC